MILCFKNVSVVLSVGYGARASRPHHKQIERALCAIPCVDKTTRTEKPHQKQLVHIFVVARVVSRVSR